MTREEEIEKAAQKCEWISKSLNLQSAFIEGAKWADKTMLEWLGNELRETDDRDGYPTVESRSFVSVEEFINECRQAMEGGTE